MGPLTISLQGFIFFSLKKIAKIFQLHLRVPVGHSHHQVGVLHSARARDKLPEDNFAELIQTKVESNERRQKFSKFYRKSYVDSIVKPNFEDAEIMESFLFKSYITGQEVEILGRYCINTMFEYFRLI